MVQWLLTKFQQNTIFPHSEGQLFPSAQNRTFVFSTNPTVLKCNFLQSSLCRSDCPIRAHLHTRRVVLVASRQRRWPDPIGSAIRQPTDLTR